MQSAYKPQFEDWLYYAHLPLAAYALLALSAAVAFWSAREALFGVGAAALLLLFIGIHNSWDSVAYHVFVQRREKTQGPQHMEIKRVGSQPSNKGPSDWFTGAVRIDPLFQAPDPAFVQGASVTFEPGARTAWHTHPLGQTLIIAAGLGWAQRWGGPVEEIRPGDVVWFPPGEKHWHGATPTTAMTHIAIQEKKDGKVVEWMEHVTDEQYRE